MPRIVPIQLLRCLKVLLNANGGILSRGEVERISTLMGKYSKKLVSKCIYVQILKCTDTDLLDEFMRANGWNLVFNWLFDGIRLSNWPLVQEILELLLLCPVDVNRLKLNSAPKTVKALSLTGGTEGVRILAQRLVEQWLKIVTEGNEANQQAQSAAVSSTTQDVEDIKEEADSEPENIVKEEPEADPLDVPDNTTSAAANLTPTRAQKNASKSGLVYKIVVKDGQQLLTKIDNVQKTENVDNVDAMDVDENESRTMATESLIEEEEEEEDNSAIDIVEEDSTSLDKVEDKESGESSSTEIMDKKIKERKTSVSSDTTVSVKNKEQREHKSKDSKSKEHKSDKDKNKDKDRKSSSSSSSHRSTSSSSHKSSSKSSSSSSSSSSKSKSSSTSHRSSSDKHRSDKDRNSSSSSSSNKEKEREKERSGSSSSSKHKSSSSSSKSSSSSSKERHRDKDKEKSSSSSSKKDKEREKELQTEKDKDTLAKMLPPSIEKLGRIPKKPRDDKEDLSSTVNSGSSSNSNNNSKHPTSITIPSKKASISIEIRRDAEKSSAVKTYKSQFRSHGLTEEAPPPPSRKTLKKPGSTHSSSVPTQTATVIPTSLPSSLKRLSPPPKDVPVEKKQKIDVNSITPAAASVPEKPGAIKLIPPKRIQTLVETNLFSDALSAATGPKKVLKRKRPATANGKDEPTTPTSPDAHKVAPLKFYQDTLDESAKSASDDKTSEKTKIAAETTNSGSGDENAENSDKDKDKDTSSMIIDDDDDIPLNKVKEDIEQRVLKEKEAESSGKAIDITSDAEDEAKTEGGDSPIIDEVRKPGPGCGPNGPPGVLMLHRRKGPKKKLTWRPQETLEQIRYFEMDENERVNVMKVSFSDMKNMERFNERASLTNLTRRGPRPGDTQEPRTEWRPLIEVDDVPEHPNGNGSKERKVQADREMTTLRALYFSPNMIPDSPSEAELELHSTVDPPAIPLDDITGNPDAVNDFSSMPWPEPKGSPRNNDSGTGGLGLGNAAADMFGALNAATLPTKPPAANNMPAANPFNNFMHPFGGVGVPPVAPNNMPPAPQQMSPNNWQGPPQMQPGPMMPNPFQGHPNPTPQMMMGGTGPNFIPPQRGNAFNAPPFMPVGSPPYGPSGFAPNGPNFGPMGPSGCPPPMMNNMNNMGLMNGPRSGVNNMGMGNNRNNQNWIHGPQNNFQENNGAWRPAGSGNNNNGVCKAFMRGNCRNGKNCKFVHPKSRR